MSTLYPTNVASSVPFDNDTNGMNSENTQEAIEEAWDQANLAIALPRFALASVHNATLSNGQLVGVSNLVNVPIVAPIKSVLKEVTFYQDGGSNRDGSYRFYKGTEIPGNLFFTWSLNNTTTAVAEDITDYTSPTFLQGDLLRVFFDDTGSNHQDVSIHYLFQAVE